TSCFLTTFLYSAALPLNLRSFPTRRSSDLAKSLGATLSLNCDMTPPLVGKYYSGSAARSSFVRRSERIFSAVMGSDITAEKIRSDRKSTRLNSSHQIISYAVFCLKKKNKKY